MSAGLTGSAAAIRGEERGGGCVTWKQAVNTVKSHSKILGTLLDAVQWIFGPCYRHPGLNFIPLANNIKSIDSSPWSYWACWKMWSTQMLSKGLHDLPEIKKRSVNFLQSIENKYFNFNCIRWKKINSLHFCFNHKLTTCSLACAESGACRFSCSAGDAWIKRLSRYIVYFY